MHEIHADSALKQRKKCNESHLFYPAITKVKEAECFHEWLFRVALLLGRYSNPQDSASRHSPGAPGRPISLGWWTRVEEAIFPYSPLCPCDLKGVSKTIKTWLLLMKQRWIHSASEFECIFISPSVRPVHTRVKGSLRAKRVHCFSKITDTEWILPFDQAQHSIFWCIFSRTKRFFGHFKVL